MASRVPSPRASYGCKALGMQILRRTMIDISIWCSKIGDYVPNALSMPIDGHHMDSVDRVPRIYKALPSVNGSSLANT